MWLFELVIDLSQFQVYRDRRRRLGPTRDGLYVTDPWFRGDVGVIDDRVAAVGQLTAATADVVIDARGSELPESTSRQRAASVVVDRLAEALLVQTLRLFLEHAPEPS